MEEHVCEALAIHCIDFRIQRFLNEYLDKRFSDGYDRVAVAGGVKSLPLDQCTISYKLHHPKMFVLVQHEDCGAYGGSEAFGDFTTEQAFQKEQLANAEKLLQKHFLDTSVEKFLVRLSGELILVV